MLPTRPKDIALADVLNRLLDKGVFLKAELILTLANVPLIKIDLTALIAGIETYNQTFLKKGNEVTQSSSSEVTQKNSSSIESVYQEATLVE